MTTYLKKKKLQQLVQYGYFLTHRILPKRSRELYFSIQAKNILQAFQPYTFIYWCAYNYIYLFIRIISLF